MGAVCACLFKAPSNQQQEPTEQDQQPKTFSWEKRKLNPKDFQISGENNTTTGRMPSTVNGQQMIIENCENTTIYIFDHLATITVDNCKNCRIFIGPVKTSVFLRNCQRCNVVTFCGQFRSRDCRNLNVFLYCKTKPIIESSVAVKFACVQMTYPQLNDHLKEAQCEPFNNNWSCVYDFTPETVEKNFSFFDETVCQKDYVPSPVESPFSAITLSDEIGQLEIPVSYGPDVSADQSTLVIFLPTETSQHDAITFYRTMSANYKDWRLRRSTELKLAEPELGRVLAEPDTGHKYAGYLSRGPVVFMDLAGPIDNHGRSVESALQLAGLGQPVVEAVVVLSGRQAERAFEALYGLADSQLQSI